MFKPLNINDLVQFYKTFDEFAKGTGTLTSGAGVAFYNKVYGALLWWQVNRRANAFSIIPTVEYPHSGWRAIPSNPSTKSNIVPASESDLGSVVYPDVENLSTQPFVVSAVAEISDVMEALSSKRDDVALEASQLKIHLGVGMINALNQQILHPVETAPIANAWTSLDWIVGADNEVNKNAGWGVNIYGVDRSVKTWARALLDQDSGITPRALTKAMLIDMLARVRGQGGEPTCWLMHPSMIGNVQNLFESAVLLSIVGEKQIKVDVNGISSYDGYGVGLTVSTLFGFPIIPDAFIDTSTTKNPDGKIYLLSFGNEQGIGPEIGKAFLLPFMAFESRDFATMNKAVVRMVYRASGDLVCRRFNIQGKIRDVT